MRGTSRDENTHTHTRTHLAFIIHPTQPHPRHDIYSRAHLLSTAQSSADPGAPNARSTPALSRRKVKVKKMGVVHKVVRKAASLESQMVANRRAAPPSPMASAPSPAPAPASSSSSSSATAVSKYPRFGRRGAPQVSVLWPDRGCLLFHIPPLFRSLRKKKGSLGCVGYGRVARHLWSHTTGEMMTRSAHTAQLDLTATPNPLGALA